MIFSVCVLQDASFLEVSLCTGRADEPPSNANHLVCARQVLPDTELARTPTESHLTVLGGKYDDYLTVCRLC